MSWWETLHLVTWWKRLGISAIKTGQDAPSWIWCTERLSFFGGGHIVLQRFVHVRCHFQPLPTKLVFAYFDRGSYIYISFVSSSAFVTFKAWTIEKHPRRFAWHAASGSTWALTSAARKESIVIRKNAWKTLPYQSTPYTPYIVGIYWVYNNMFIIYLYIYIFPFQRAPTGGSQKLRYHPKGTTSFPNETYKNRIFFQQSLSQTPDIQCDMQWLIWLSKSFIICPVTLEKTKVGPFSAGAASFNKCFWMHRERYIKKHCISIYYIPVLQDCSHVSVLKMQ